MFPHLCFRIYVSPAATLYRPCRSAWRRALCLSVILQNSQLCARPAYHYTMEHSYNRLKKLQVICINDGKNLGRVCDVLFLYPENKIKGFSVTGGRGFRIAREEQFVPWGQIIKIGRDVVLIKREEKPKGSCPPPCPPLFGRTDCRDDGECE